MPNSANSAGDNGNDNAHGNAHAQWSVWTTGNAAGTPEERWALAERSMAWRRAEPRAYMQRRNAELAKFLEGVNTDFLPHVIAALKSDDYEFHLDAYMERYGNYIMAIGVAMAGRFAVEQQMTAGIEVEINEEVAKAVADLPDFPTFG